MADNRAAKAILAGLVIWGAFVLRSGAAAESGSAARAREWPRLRGPNGQGISTARMIPVRWTETDYNWKVKLPGGGHSSPVVWHDRLFVTSGDKRAGRSILLALRAADGKVLWQREHALGQLPMHARNSCATATPAVDADHVYALWITRKEATLAAFAHDGKEVWKRTFPGVHCPHAAGTSPAVVDDVVVFTREHEASGPDPSSWVAVDRKTGQTRWELARRTSIKTSYSTPCLYTPRGEAPQLIFTSLAHGVSGVDLRTGKVAWEVKGAFRWRVVASPVIADGLVVASCGQRAVVVKPGSKDPPAPPAIVRDKGPIPYCSTPLAKDGLLFVFRDDGRAYCLRAATGEQLWCQRPGGRFAGSPVWVDGRLYCITMDGRVVVIRAAAKYELLAVNPLGEPSQATPAVAGERMVLRTWSHLISIGGTKTKPSG